MEQLAQAWAWVAAHPAEAAWCVFAAISALVAVYRTRETQIKAIVARTDTKADDWVVACLDKLVAVFEIVKLLVPHGLARSKPQDPKP